MAQITNSFPINLGDIVQEDDFRGRTIDAFRNPWAWDVVAGGIGLMYGPRAGNRADELFGVRCLPALPIHAVHGLRNAYDAITSMGRCEFRNAASSTHAFTLDAAGFGYALSKICSFAKSIGLTRAPKLGSTGIVSLGYLAAGGVYSNASVICDRTLYAGSSVIRDLREANVRKNTWEFGENVITLIYCVFTYLGVVFSAGVSFAMVLAGYACSFGAQMEKSGMQNRAMRQLLTY